MKHVKKFTSGFLCRDKNRHGACYVLFFRVDDKSALSIRYGGLWQGPGSTVWSPERFLKIYKKEDLPKKGEIIEVDMEL